MAASFICCVLGVLPVAGCGVSRRQVRLSQDSVLHVLRERLSAIRGAAPDAHIDFPPDLDPSPLVGLGAGRLEEVFGSPTWCNNVNAHPIPGDSELDHYPFNPGLPPCVGSSHWIYSFHHLPQGSLGGGTVLIVAVGDSGRVSGARWIATK